MVTIEKKERSNMIFQSTNTSFVNELISNYIRTTFPNKFVILFSGSWFEHESGKISNCLERFASLGVSEKEAMNLFVDGGILVFDDFASFLKAYRLFPESNSPKNEVFTPINAFQFCFDRSR